MITSWIDHIHIEQDYFGPFTGIFWACKPGTDNLDAGTSQVALAAEGRLMTYFLILACFSKLCGAALARRLDFSQF